MTATKKVSVRDRLFGDLLANYQKAIDPGKTELTLGVSPLFVNHDKSTKELTIGVFEYHSWKDTRLTWDPNNYDGVKSLRIPAKLVWTPDTRLYNTVPAIVERDSDVNVVVTSDGTVLWVPRSNYRIPCEEKNPGQLGANVKIGSWTYTGHDISLKMLKPEGFDLSFYDPTCHYVIGDQSAKISDIMFDNEPYPTLEISFTVKQR